MIEIEIDQEFQEFVHTDNLALVAEKVLSLTDTNPNSEISLRITNDLSLQELNLQYMDIDAPTDVLSFPVSFENPDTGNPYLGDILISYPTAARQADEAEHSSMEEIKLLLVHGILHLLGYDHTTPEDKEGMWTLQDNILTALGVKARPTE